MGRMFWTFCELVSVVVFIRVLSTIDARETRQANALRALRARRQRDPLFPSELAGTCVTSSVSGREICYPDLSILDYSCVKKNGDKKTVPPPLIRHGQYKALITKFRPGEARRDDRTGHSAKPFLVVQYQCNPGHELLDEAEFLFCRDHQWIQTLPVCVPSSLVDKIRQKGNPCQLDNGGCSHICHDLGGGVIRCDCPSGMFLDPGDYRSCREDDSCVVANGGCSHICQPPPKHGLPPVCSCPENFILGSDKKTCFETKDWIVKPMNCPQVPYGHPSCDGECVHDDDCAGEKKCCSNGCAYVCLSPDLVEKSLPDVSINPPGPLEVRPGGQVNLTCTGTGFPLPSLTWYQNEKRMSQKESGLGRADPSLTSAKTIFIKELFTTSTFRCEAVNDFGWKSVETKVTVLGPGSMPHTIRHRVRGTNITLTWKPPVFSNGPLTGYKILYTSGDPRKPLATWQSVEVENVERTVISGLEPLTRYYFRIQAVNDRAPGVLSLTFHISTQEREVAPSVMIEGFDAPYGRVLLEPLGSVDLICRAVAGWPQPSLAWYREGGVPISEPSDKAPAIDLKLTHVMETTRFECIAINKVGSANGTVDVVVTGPGTPPQQIQYRVVDGTNVDLSWGAPSIKNGPIIGYVVFYTADIPDAPLDEWDAEVIDKAQSTVLRHLRPNSTYHLRIQAFNELGHGPASPAVTIDIGAPWALPSITLEPRPTAPVEPGSKLNVTCRATGVPLPSLTWKKGGEEIVSVPAFYGPGEGLAKVLVIERIFETTQFTCEATNSAGTMVSDLEVVVRGPGSPPENVQATADRQTIAVTWEDPEYPNGEIQGYNLYFIETANDTQPLHHWTRVVVDDGQQFEWRLKNLNYQTPYTMRMSAFTRDPDGQPLEGVMSEKVYATTSREGEPPTIVMSPSAPLIQILPGGRINVTCTGVGLPEPQVKWYKNGKLMGVEVNPDLPPGTVVSSVDLVIEHVYETSSFECRAVNPLGTAAAGVRVDVLGPGSPPRDIYPIIYSNSIDIQWQEPALKNGLITGYEVYYTSDPTLRVQDWATKFVPGSADHHKLTALLPNTNYTYMVRAFNQHGPGPWSVRHTVTTGSLESKPRITTLPHGDVHRVRVGDTVNLTCAAEGFPPPTVTWHMETMVQDPRFVPESQEVSLSIDNVREPFSIGCIATNPLGEDRKTIRVEVTGLGGAPTKLEGVAKGTTARVRWNAPEVVEADIKYFLLYYTRHPEVPDERWHIASVPLRLPDEPSHYYWEIPNLKAYTQYTFKVRAYTNEGPGPFSNVITLNTTEKWFIHMEVHPDATTEVPVGGGIDLLCKTKGIPPPLVSWKINGKAVMAEPRPYVSILKLDPVNDITSVTCVAENEMDVSDIRVQLVPSDRWQSSGVPTSWPDEDDGSTVLDWTDLLVVAEEGTLYTIYYTKNSTLPLDEWSHLQTGYPLNMRLPNMTEDQVYYLRVRIVPPEKEWSVITAPTQVITPKFPSNVTIFVEDDMTKLEWDVVKIPHSTITGYTIYYTDDHQRSLKEWHSEEIQAGATNKASILNVHPDTPYYVRLLIRTDKGERLPTTVYQTRSPEFNRCEWAKCEHLCDVLEDEFDAECSCRPDFQLNDDGRSCSIPGTVLPPAAKWPPPSAIDEICLDEPDPGSCQEKSEKVWYYNATLGECVPFTFGGCDGNKNRFTDPKRCMEHCSAKPCLEQRRQSVHLPVGHRPKCDDNGDFEPAQVNHEKEQYFCVHPVTGKEVVGTRLNSSSAGGQPYCKSCELKREYYLSVTSSPTGPFPPDCDPKGHYDPAQCDPISGQCWCVDQLTGRELEGTRVSMGPKPECALMPGIKLKNWRVYTTEDNDWYYGAWQPVGNATAKAYLIYFTVRPNEPLNKWYVITVRDPTQPAKLIEHKFLPPNTTSAWVLQPIFDEGPGEISDQYVVIPDAPGQPSGLRAEDITSTTVKLKWSRDSDLEPAGITYTFYAETINGNKSQFKSSNVWDEFTLPVEPDQAYQVYITATDSSGREGPPSTKITFRSLPLATAETVPAKTEKPDVGVTVAVTGVQTDLPGTATEGEVVKTTEITGARPTGVTEVEAGTPVPVSLVSEEFTAHGVPVTISKGPLEASIGVPAKPSHLVTTAHPGLAFDMSTPAEGGASYSPTAGKGAVTPKEAVSTGAGAAATIEGAKATASPALAKKITAELGVTPVSTVAVATGVAGTAETSPTPLTTGTGATSAEITRAVIRTLTGEPPEAEVVGTTIKAPYVGEIGNVTAAGKVVITSTTLRPGTAMVKFTGKDGRVIKGTSTAAAGATTSMGEVEGRYTELASGAPVDGPGINFTIAGEVGLTAPAAATAGLRASSELTSAATAPVDATGAASIVADFTTVPLESAEAPGTVKPVALGVTEQAAPGETKFPAVTVRPTIRPAAKPEMEVSGVTRKGHTTPKAPGNVTMVKAMPGTRPPKAPGSTKKPDVVEKTSLLPAVGTSIVGLPVAGKATTVLPTMTAKKCDQIDVPLDLVIVLDASNSNAVVDHPLIKGALREMLESYFVVDDDHVRVAFVQYSDLMAVEFALGQYSSKQDMLEHVLRVPHMVGSSRTEEALAAALDLIQSGGRLDDVPKVVLVITDGLWIGDASLSAWQLQESAVYTLAVGVGPKVSAEELSSIVGGHEDRTVAYPTWTVAKTQLPKVVLDKICAFLASLDTMEEPLPETTEVPEDTSAPPSAPNLHARVENISSSSAVVIWEVDDELWRGPYLAFEIGLIDRSSGSIQRFNVSSAAGRHVFALRPNKEYTVLLTARGDSIDRSPPSRSVTFLSLPAAPKTTKAPTTTKPSTAVPTLTTMTDLRLPGEVSITDVKLGEEVTWEVDDSKRDTSAWEFIVFHAEGIYWDSSLPPATHQMVISDGRSRQHSLTSVEFPSTNYTFWIRARNEHGDGPLSTAFIVTRPWPSIAVTTGTSASSAALPRSTKPADIKEGIAKTVSPVKPKISTKRPSVTIAAAPAAAPVILEVDQISASEAKIAWTIDGIDKPPADWDFVVYYTSDATLPRDQWTLRYATRADAKGFRLRGLKPDQEYTICIRARNTFGLGPSSNCVDVYLLDIPTVPSGTLQTAKSTARSTTISPTPPGDAAPPISGRTVGPEGTGPAESAATARTTKATAEPGVTTRTLNVTAILGVTRTVEAPVITGPTASSGATRPSGVTELQEASATSDAAVSEVAGITEVPSKPDAAVTKAITRRPAKTTPSMIYKEAPHKFHLELFEFTPNTVVVHWERDDEWQPPDATYTFVVTDNSTGTTFRIKVPLAEGRHTLSVKPGRTYTIYVVSKSDQEGVMQFSNSLTFITSVAPGSARGMPNLTSSEEFTPSVPLEFHPVITEIDQVSNTAIKVRWMVEDLDALPIGWYFILYHSPDPTSPTEQWKKTNATPGDAEIGKVIDGLKPAEHYGICVQMRNASSVAPISECIPIRLTTIVQPTEGPKTTTWRSTTPRAYPTVVTVLVQTPEAHTARSHVLDTEQSHIPEEGGAITTGPPGATDHIVSTVPATTTKEDSIMATVIPAKETTIEAEGRAEPVTPTPAFEAEIDAMTPFTVTVALRWDQHKDFLPRGSLYTFTLINNATGIPLRLKTSSTSGLYVLAVRPNTTYTLSATSANKESGMTQTSNVVVFKTPIGPRRKTAVPTEPVASAIPADAHPVITDIEQVSETSINVRWSIAKPEVLPSDWYSTLYYSSNPSLPKNKWTEVPTAADDVKRGKTIDGLKSEVLYEICIGLRNTSFLGPITYCVPVYLISFSKPAAFPRLLVPEKTTRKPKAAPTAVTTRRPKIPAGAVTIPVEEPIILKRPIPKKLKTTAAVAPKTTAPSPKRPSKPLATSDRGSTTKSPATKTKAPARRVTTTKTPPARPTLGIKPTKAVEKPRMTKKPTLSAAVATRTTAAPAVKPAGTARTSKATPKPKMTTKKPLPSGVTATLAPAESTVTRATLAPEVTTKPALGPERTTAPSAARRLQGPGMEGGDIVGGTTRAGVTAEASGEATTKQIMPRIVSAQSTTGEVEKTGVPVAELATKPTSSKEASVSLTSGPETAVQTSLSGVTGPATSVPESWPSSATPVSASWTSPLTAATATPAYQEFTLSIPPEQVTMVSGCNCTCVILVEDHRRRCYFDNETARPEPAISVHRKPNGQVVVKVGDKEYETGKERDCDKGKAEAPPPGAAKEQDLRFVLTTPVPPEKDADCPCVQPMSGEQCPPGYRLWKGRCRDIDECEYKNGGCSHGCVNTPGGFYCACPPGLFRDPNDPFECVSQELMLKRMAQMMYIHMWQNGARRPGVSAKPVDSYEAAVEEHKRIGRPSGAPGIGHTRAVVGNGTDAFSLEWQWSEFLKKWRFRR